MAEISPQLRALVYQRDNRQCQACGNAVAGGWLSVQHRKARGQGGQNTADNCVLLCGSATTGCHRRAENRDAEMVARGFVVWSWQDPADIPVERWDGERVWLLADGGLKFSWQASD